MNNIFPLNKNQIDRALKIRAQIYIYIYLYCNVYENHKSILRSETGARKSESESKRDVWL